MSWERDPLWAKARLFVERAFDESREDPLFGLWCSLGLELLARAAVASVSPTLLAEPDKDQKNLLHALGRGSEKPPRKSIGVTRVFELCQRLFPDFSEEDKTAAVALVNRRNEELHSGGSAFDEYPTRLWLGDFYRICLSLTKVLGEPLEKLFGTDEAEIATQVLKEIQTEVKKRVFGLITSHRKIFELKTAAERQAAAESAKQQGDRLSRERHHRVSCPACGSTATVQGTPFGSERVIHDEDGIIVKQSVAPRTFQCPACGLKLEGYAELDAAQVGGHYTRTTSVSPEDFYGLINEDDFDPEPYVEKYLSDLAEYDND